ncbi:hypothetical protein J3F83DRAFT_714932 [Trichoderma novae-zelandiae]
MVTQNNTAVLHDSSPPTSTISVIWPTGLLKLTLDYSTRMLSLKAANGPPINVVPGFSLRHDSSSFNAELLASSYGFQIVGDQTHKLQMTCLPAPWKGLSNIVKRDLITGPGFGTSGSATNNI